MSEPQEMYLSMLDAMRARAEKAERERDSSDTPCREGFLEAQRAFDLRKRIVWIGRPTLTVRAFIGPASRLVVVENVDQALRALEVQP